MAYTREKSTLWDETGSVYAQEVTNLLQQVEGGPAGYRLRRILLTNFWLYEYQVIEIPHGRLFLAGDNGSGKSTVLTAAITLALDGDYRPERIDTFGKREKKIDYYILGGSESNTPFIREQRTSYICLEFEWCAMKEPPFASELRERWERGEHEQARFLTIGIGFAGNKNNVNTITALRFLITDGTRMGAELSTLVPTPGENPRACDLKTFKKVVSAHGIICENQQEYERKVSQYLFNFKKPEDLTRLARQLLYLRQPNLNSVLSLEKVRSYLDESLPELPLALIEQAAEMLDMMEELQATTEKRKSAFNATEKVHRTQQIATMARARLSACECLYALEQLEGTRKEVLRLERGIKRIERDIERHQERIQVLEREQSELAGKISALENSEGLQLAQRLTQIQSQMTTCEENLSMSQNALTRGIDRREQTEDDLDGLHATFQQYHSDALQLLQAMQQSARQDALWSIAADQLYNTLERVTLLSLSSSLLDIPEHLSSLGETATTAYLQWLERLRQLHQELGQISASLSQARRQEQQAAETLDDMTRQFERDREQVCIAQQNLADRLEQMLDQTEWTPLLPSAEQAALTWNASLLPTEAVPALIQLQQTYFDTIKRVGEAIDQKQSQLQRLLNEAHGERGAREREVEQIKAAYQAKLREPEFVPARSSHRQQARERLAAQGIQALPFYMLVDFTEQIDSQSPLAGGIEQALEDAGLLDALVVLPEHTETMDACCLAHGLSDCRFDLHRLESSHLALLPLARALRVDPALAESVGEQFPVWAETVSMLLEGMQRALTPEAEPERWVHGLLAGTVGTGTARCIGKATRVRTQQQELERLRQQQASLEQALASITAKIAGDEEHKQSLESLGKQVKTLVPESQLNELSATLLATLGSLNQVQARYNQAQEASRELAQKAHTLQIRLQRETEHVLVFASERARVEQAHEAVNRLRSDHRTLISYLRNVRETWQRYQSTQQKLEQDKIIEREALLARQRAEKAMTQVSAEMDMLERLARETGEDNIETLLRQLTNWQARQLDLPNDLKKAEQEHISSQTTLQLQQTSYAAALDTQNRAEKNNATHGQRFHALLAAYPVEILLEIQKQIEENALNAELLQQALGQPMASGEEAYILLKADLEKHNDRTRNELSQAFVEVNSLLHEYGPHWDDAGIVRFTNAEEVNAYELLGRLGEEIRQHEQLLEAKEKQLFQDFLLKELANTVGTRMTDAETWVRKMNSILASSTFIGERYHLRWGARPHDPARPGSYLAQFRDVLRRQSETFNVEETEALVHAFRQEINGLRNQQVGSTATFAEALISILDYRRWFQFEIDVVRPDGTSQHLTTKFFKKGSGAEQYIALYIPFFAALSALYESAGQGAPRLIALDEAFDKVSTENTRKLLNFLAEQNFQWIMTGPRVTGEGTALPACVKYTMFCRKTDELAAGFPSFWSSNPALAREVQGGR